MNYGNLIEYKIKNWFLLFLVVSRVFGVFVIVDIYCGVVCVFLYYKLLFKMCLSGSVYFSVYMNMF